MRLLSYNIHKGVGGRDRLYRIDRVIQVIEAEKPDFVCLQEVDQNVRRSLHDDQPALIAKAVAAEGLLYQINVKRKAGGYGNLMLSRWPFMSQHQFSIRYKRHWPRGAQLAVIDTPEGPFQLVHSHLGLAERERHWQVGHVLTHPRFVESAHLPTIMVGDLNDWRNTLTKGPFAEHGFHQVTAPRSRFRSFPAFLPMVSLDKAFSRGSIHIHQARIVHSPMARRASDHLPLVVDFGLKA